MVPKMKTAPILLLLMQLAFHCHGQQAINSDTIITKNTRVNDSFELGFEDLPGAGYMWQLYENADTMQVKIKPVKTELMKGYQPIGGKYITTYSYTPLSTGTFLLEYNYGRPWLKEKAKKCVLKIIAD